jgi:hypothetical protein
MLFYVILFYFILFYFILLQAHAHLHARTVALDRLRQCEEAIASREADGCPTPALEVLRRERLLTLYASAKYYREAAETCRLMAAGAWVPTPMSCPNPAEHGGALLLPGMVRRGSEDNAVTPLSPDPSGNFRSMPGQWGTPASAPPPSSTTPIAAAAAPAACAGGGSGLAPKQTEYEKNVAKGALEASSLTAAALAARPVAGGGAATMPNRCAFIVVVFVVFVVVCLMFGCLFVCLFVSLFVVVCLLFRRCCCCCCCCD